MKLKWIIVFTHPGVALPTRMGSITHAKMQRILDSIHRYPADTDRIMDTGVFDDLENVRFYREDMDHLITVMEQDNEEFFYVNTVAAY